MALEDLTGAGKFVSALNPAWPVDDDWVDEGDNHVRGIKNVLKNTFPVTDGALHWSSAQARFPDGTLAAPGISWINEPTSGWRRAGANTFQYVVNAVPVVSVAPAAVNVVGGLKASSTGAFAAGAGAHEVLQHVDTAVAFSITHQGNVDPLGLSIKYNNYNARSPGDLYLQFNDANGALGYFTGNGGMVNYKANDGDISDARLKRDISDAPDYTELVGKLAFRRFRYVDQPEMGAVDNVLAQELEALAPELIGPNLAGTEFKTIYSDRLQQRINSVIPRLIARIAALEEKLGAGSAGS